MWMCGVVLVQKSSYVYPTRQSSLLWDIALLLGLLRYAFLDSVHVVIPLNSLQVDQQSIYASYPLSRQY